MSALLTTTMVQMKTTIEALEENRWIDCQPGFETSHYLDGFAYPDRKFRFKPDWENVPVARKFDWGIAGDMVQEAAAVGQAYHLGIDDHIYGSHRSHGEILAKSPSVFIGYYKNPEATEKTLEDGWLHSDDKGFIDDDGHLVVFDRTKDVFILKDGQPFSPQYLETRLKFSPYVKDAWVLGNNRDYVSAVMCIDYSVVGNWADEKKINYTSYIELSQKPEVYELVEKQIHEANKDLPEAARVHRFTNLYKELDADDDELTRTRKLRRAFVEKRYKVINTCISFCHCIHFVM